MKREKGEKKWRSKGRAGVAMVDSTDHEELTTQFHMLNANEGP